MASLIGSSDAFTSFTGSSNVVVSQVSSWNSSQGAVQQTPVVVVAHPTDSQQDVALDTDLLASFAKTTYVDAQDAAQAATNAANISSFGNQLTPLSEAVEGISKNGTVRTLRGAHTHHRGNLILYLPLDGNYDDPNAPAHDVLALLLALNAKTSSISQVGNELRTDQNTAVVIGGAIYAGNLQFQQKNDGADTWTRLSDYLENHKSLLAGLADKTQHLTASGYQTVYADISCLSVAATGDVSGKNLKAENDVSCSTVTASGVLSCAGVSSTGGVSGSSMTSTGAVSCASVVASGAVSCASMTSTGGVSASSMTSTGAVSCASVSATGAVSCASVSATGAVHAQSLYGALRANTGQIDQHHDTSNIWQHGTNVRFSRVFSTPIGTTSTGVTGFCDSIQIASTWGDPTGGGLNQMCVSKHGPIRLILKRAQFNNPSLPYSANENEQWREVVTKSIGGNMGTVLCSNVTISSPTAGRATNLRECYSAAQTNQYVLTQLQGHTNITLNGDYGGTLRDMINAGVSQVSIIANNALAKAQQLVNDTLVTVSNGTVTGGKITTFSTETPPITENSPAPLCYLDKTGKLTSNYLFASKFADQCFGVADAAKSSAYLQGLVPTSDGSARKYLRADGTWSPLSKLWVASPSAPNHPLEFDTSTLWDTVTGGVAEKLEDLEQLMEDDYVSKVAFDAVHAEVVGNKSLLLLLMYNPHVIEGGYIAAHRHLFTGASFRVKQSPAPLCYVDENGGLNSAGLYESAYAEQVFGVSDAAKTSPYLAGLVPTSTGSTSQYLRADGVWSDDLVDTGTLNVSIVQIGGHAESYTNQSIANLKAAVDSKVETGSLVVSNSGSQETIGLFRSTTSDCSIRVEGKGEAYIELANTYTSGSSSHAWGIGVNDNTRLEFNWKPQGTTLNPTTNAMTMTKDGMVGIALGHLIAPTRALDVNGTCRATAFEGDGSQLTGVAALASAITAANRLCITSMVNGGTIASAPASTDLLTIEGVNKWFTDARCDARITTRLATVLPALQATTMTAQTVTALSDENLKQDIVKIDGNWATSALKDVFPASYAFKSDPNKQRFGVIAQQLRQHLPSLVHETPDHSLSVEYQGLIPLLLASLQDAHHRIAALENVVAHIPLCYE